MKIGIDISQIVYETGVSWYTKNLVEALLKIDGENEYVLFGGALRQKSKLRAQFNPKIYPISPVMADFLWNRLHILPIERLIGKLDVFHSSDWSQPPSRAYKVTTIHDLTPLIFPEQIDKRVLKAHQRRLEWVKKEVDKVIAVSDSTKADIIKYLDIADEKIAVVYEAPGEEFRRQDEEYVKQVKDQYGITGDYLLSVGTGQRKNIDKIREAFEKLNVLQELQYVVAGQGELNIGQNMVFVNRPTSQELAALYSGAAMLVYASSYEGFGLPILEAFACGCPVVTSSVSSLPEIAGGAAVLVQPDKVNSIAEGITAALAKREVLIEKGYARVKEFSWQKTAKETLKIYEQFSKQFTQSSVSS